MPVMVDVWMNLYYWGEYCFQKKYTKYLNNIVFCRPEYKTFPVKLTDPVTGILYLTYDKKHMEDLKHAIHVKEVSEGIYIPLLMSLKRFYFE